MEVYMILQIILKIHQYPLTNEDLYTKREIITSKKDRPRRNFTEEF